MSCAVENDRPPVLDFADLVRKHRDALVVVAVVIGLLLLARGLYSPDDASPTGSEQFPPLSAEQCAENTVNMGNPTMRGHVRFDGGAEVTANPTSWAALPRDVRARVADMAAADEGCRLGVNPAMITVTVRSAVTAEILEQKRLWEFY